ncbi:MAG TPA: TadE/TadG family type IV pilus assembly protein [Dongiaceae bacterium]|nr:TadE/TadG family type IV pilus assembly protein [Dongiaceae bacterium]
MRRLILRWRRLHADERGTAAVEFAIISPIFFALLLSVVDIGRYMWTLNTIQYAVDEAVRAGAVQQLTTAEIKGRVADAVKPISSTAVTVNVTEAEDSLTVTASSTYRFLFPISAILSEANINLRSEMPF